MAIFYINYANFSEEKYGVHAFRVRVRVRSVGGQRRALERHQPGHQPHLSHPGRRAQLQPQIPQCESGGEKRVFCSKN